MRGFGNTEEIPFVISASILILSYVMFVLGYLIFCIVFLLIGLIGSLISQFLKERVKKYRLNENILTVLRNLFKKIRSDIVSEIKILRYTGVWLTLFCLFAFAVKLQIITENSLVLVLFCLIFVTAVIGITYKIYVKSSNNKEFVLALLHSFILVIVLISPLLFSRSIFYVAGALLSIFGCFAIAWKAFEKRKFSLALKEASRISSFIIIVALIDGLIMGVPPVAQDISWLDSTEHALKSSIFLKDAAPKVWNGNYGDAYPLLEKAKEECKYSEKNFREYNKNAWRKNNAFSELNRFTTNTLNVVIDYNNASARMFEILEERDIGYINSSEATIYEKELTNQKNKLDETVKNMELALDETPFYLQPFIDVPGLKEKIESESRRVSYLYERKKEHLELIQQ